MTDAPCSPAPELAIDVQGMRKIYRGRHGAPDKHALKGVDLAVRRGSMFALLGPNGAGKSTLINILAGLVTKTEGQASIWGYDIDQQTRKARAAIGIVPQELNLDAFFTPRDMMELQAGMYGVPASQRRTDQILEAVGLSDKADVYARTLSGGMRRRLMVAKAMVHNPPILVLDEPTAGVDIELRQQLWANVRALNARGTTVLLTTHYLEEAEELCDTIAIINHGAVVCCEPKEQLLSRLDQKALVVTLDAPITQVPEGLKPYQPVIAGRQVKLFYRRSETRVGALIDQLQDLSLGIVDLSTEEPDLEDVFLALTSSRAA